MTVAELDAQRAMVRASLNLADTTAERHGTYPVRPKEPKA